MARGTAEHTESLSTLVTLQDMSYLLIAPISRGGDTLHADFVCSKHYNDDGLEPSSAEFEGRTRQLRVIYAP
jgi:hypothetical protein